MYSGHAEAMFLQPVIGHTLAFGPIDDPPGGRAYSLADQVLAELTWSKLDGAVRIETDGGVWRVRLDGLRIIRGVVQGPAGAWDLLYAGSLCEGVALTRAGERFDLFRQVDPEHGLWLGIDDDSGGGVLRTTGRVSSAGIWSEVLVTPDARYRKAVWPLLFLWGGLRVLGEHHLWLRMTSWATSKRAAAHALDALAARLAS